MKKSSTTLDYFIASKHLAGRLQDPRVVLQKHIATHRPVMASFACQVEHLEPRVRMQAKMAAEPRSPVGPLNRPADWTKAMAAINRTIAAANEESNNTAPAKSKKQMKEVHTLHARAYKALADTMEQEVVSKFDENATCMGMRARPLKIELVKAKPIQPKNRIKLRFGVLPYRWLQEQGHLYFQHLMQTLCVRPKLIDEMDLPTFSNSLKEDVLEQVSENNITNKLHTDLVVQVAAVIADQGSGVLADTRPMAMQSLRKWEEKLHEAMGKEDSLDKKDATQKWREWAQQSAANGAGRAHRWTKAPVPWKTKVAKTATSEQEDAVPMAIRTDLKKKYAAIWRPSTVPWPASSKVQFPEWVPHPFAGKVTGWESSDEPQWLASEASRMPEKDDEPYDSPEWWEPTHDTVDEQRLRERQWEPIHEPQCEGQIQPGSIPWQEVRAASRTFRKSTSQTYDGFHVCQWQHLEPIALEVTAKLFCLSLALGMLPEQVRAVVAAAIPKTTAGYRTVGLFSSYYRLLMRTVRPLAQDWEANHPNRLFSFTSGRSAVLTVWGQVAKQEVTSAIGRPSSATILWDLSDFYEGMSRGKLLQRAVDLDFDLATTVLSLTAYSGERVIVLDGLATSVGHPTKGVIAGCGLATYHVQVYHTAPLTAFTSAHQNLDLNVHIDDFGLTATGRSDDEVVLQLSAGAAALHNVVQTELECEVAVAKADLVASSDALRRRVGKAMEQLGQKWAPTTAVNLGIDITGGLPRRRSKHKKISERMKTQQQRRARIQRLRRGNSKAAQRVFEAGVSPAIEYGSQVWGFSCKEVHDLQTLYLATTAPTGKGKSRSLSLILLGDAAWRPATAPIAAYATLVWQVLTMPARAAVPLAVLHEWYRAAQKMPTPRDWGDVCGPFSAMKLSLRRIGWQQLSFATFRDAIGNEHNVSSIGPRMFTSLLRGAWRNRLSKIASDNLASKLSFAISRAEPTDGEIGNRARQWESTNEAARPGIDLYHATSLLRAKAGGENLLNPLQCSCLTNFVVGGVWPQDRLYQAGYDVDLHCKVCKHGLDSIEHRLFMCPGSRRAREQLRWDKGHGSLEEAKQQYLCRQGLALDPTWMQPAPATDGNKKFVYTDVDFDTAFGDSEHLYTDGGCTKQFHPKLNRASWSVAVINDEGDYLAACAGPVWANLPQTSPAGEYCGFAAACQMAKGVAKDLVADYIGVVKTVKKVVGRIQAGASRVGTPLHRGSTMYAGILREAFAEKGAALISKATHVRSHQADDGELPPNISAADKKNILGNMAADDLATEALADHPPLDAEEMSISRKHFYMARNVCHLAALALPEWQGVAAKGKLQLREEVLVQRSIQKHERSKNAPLQLQQRLTADGGHFWVPFGAHGFRCTFCAARSTKEDLRRKSAHQCARDLGKLGAVLTKADHTGHSLHWSVHQRTGLRVLSCSRCDAYATLAPKHLLEACVPRSYKPNWDRLADGRFPTNRYGNTKCFFAPVRATSASIAVESWWEPAHEPAPNHTTSPPTHPAHVSQNQLKILRMNRQMLNKMPDPASRIRRATRQHQKRRRPRWEQNKRWRWWKLANRSWVARGYPRPAMGLLVHTRCQCCR